MPNGSVLIVEGNPGALIVARNVLGRADYIVGTCGSPAEGLRKAQADLPDIVVLDAAFASPEMLRAISDASPSTLPIILSVPMGLGEQVQDSLPDLEGVEFGGVLEKPFTPDTLLEAVREVFIDHQRTGPLRIDASRLE